MTIRRCRSEKLAKEWQGKKDFYMISPCTAGLVLWLLNTAGYRARRLISLGVYLVSVMSVDTLKVFSKLMNLLYLSFRYLFWLYSCVVY